MEAKLRLSSKSTVSGALLAFAHEILAEARAAIDDPERTDTVAVHDFRKAMKRWRAWLRLVAPLVGPDARRLRDEARDLARGLAAARDTQAALDALKDIQKENFLSERSWTGMRERLEVMQQNAQNVALTDSLREDLRGALDAATHAIADWPLAEVEFPQFAKMLAKGYAKARAAMPGHWEEADDETLHTLRKWVVAHRYQMDLVGPLWPRLGKLWVDEAQRLRDRLGAHQDLTVLTRLTTAHQPLAPWRSRLDPLIASRKAAHVAAAARFAGRLFCERPKHFRRRLFGLWTVASADGA